MSGIKQLSAIVAPLDRANVDTDAIIPKQFLAKVNKIGFGKHLFHEWRYLDDEGTQDNPEFTLNYPQYKGAQVLLTRENFGCGSSREHAPWSIADYGFRVIIASSFADIFYGNCINNGILPITLSPEQVQQLFDILYANQGISFDVDLEAQTVSAAGQVFAFEIDSFHRHCLLNGLDAIGLTLQHADAIAAYEAQIPAWRR